MQAFLFWEYLKYMAERMRAKCCKVNLCVCSLPFAVAEPNFDLKQ